MELIKAQELTSEINGHLFDHVIRIHPAGAVRRRIEEVQELVIICVPKIKSEQVTFGGVQPQKKEYDVKSIMKKIEEISAIGEDIRAGPKQIIFNYKGVQVTLYISTLKNFGLNYLIRTGPNEFVKSIYVQANKRGLTSRNATLENRNTGEQIPTPTEPEVFRLLGLKYMDPEKRIGLTGDC